MTLRVGPEQIFTAVISGDLPAPAPEPDRTGEFISEAEAVEMRQNDAILQEQILRLQESAARANAAIAEAEAAERREQYTAEALLTRQLQDSVTTIQTPTMPAMPANTAAVSAGGFGPEYQSAMNVWTRMYTGTNSPQTITVDSVSELDNELRTWEQRNVSSQLRPPTRFNTPQEEEAYRASYDYNRGLQVGRVQGQNEQKAFDDANGKMTRKHFILIARTIGELNVSKREREQIAEKFALVLRNQGAFDEIRFKGEVERVAKDED